VFAKSSLAQEIPSIAQKLDSELNDLSNDTLQGMIDGFNQYLHRELAANYWSEYFAKIQAIWADNSQEIAERVAYGLFPFTDSALNAEGIVCEDSSLNQQIDEFLNGDAPIALKKIIRDLTDEQRRIWSSQALNYQGTAKIS
ncbi:MAG: hypothetical protein SPG61_03915, partial [Arcanobacterium sp.]|nr:hypothetical protein [Arcanobacterium sp.]